MPYRHHRYLKRTLPFYDKGPGPARYMLPPLVGAWHHDYTRRCYPEYSIAIKLKVGPFWHPETIGPGPVYKLEKGQKSNSHGNPPYIAWTFPHTFPVYGKPDPTLGPAHYHIPPIEVTKVNNPSYSLRYKHRLLKKMKSPAPTDHDLPPMFGPHVPTRTAAMEVTMKGDRKDRSKKGTPGPIYKTMDMELLKTRVPAWELGKRWREGKRNPALGPGHYNPDPDYVLSRPPRVEFGIRYNTYTGVLKTACDNL